MITDRTLDETLVELLRCQRALEALRRKRKRPVGDGVTDDTEAMQNLANGRAGQRLEHAAAKRASLDLTRKLAALRAGR